MTDRTKKKSSYTREAPKTPVPEPQLAYADNIGQASSILGLPKAALTWAKQGGCKAFRGPRVQLEEFREWWKLNGSRMADDRDLPSKDILDRQLKKQRLERELKQAEREDGKWILAKDVHSALAAIASEMNAALHAMPRELPPKLLGLDAIGIAQVLQNSVCRTIEIFQHGAAQYQPPESEWTYEI